MIELPIHLQIVCRDTCFHQVARLPRRRAYGGKPCAKTLLRPVKPKGKRADLLRWFLEKPEGRSVEECVKRFNITRQNVFAHWTAINQVHGIGYVQHGDTIAAQLPNGFNEETIFGVRKRGA